MPKITQAQKIDHIDAKVGKLDAKVGKLDAKVGKLQTAVCQLQDTTNRLTGAVAGLEVRMDRSEEDMQDVKTTVHAIFDRLDDSIVLASRNEVEIASLNMAFDRHEERIEVLEKHCLPV